MPITRTVIKCVFGDTADGWTKIVASLTALTCDESQDKVTGAGSGNGAESMDILGEALGSCGREMKSCVA